MALAVFTYQGRDPLTSPFASIQYSVLAVFYTCLLLLAVSPSNGSFHRVLTGHAIMRLGSIAYFVYLFHIPVIEISRRFVNAHTSRPTDTTVVILAYMLGFAATLVLARLSWRFFEKPLINLARAFTY